MVQSRLAFCSILMERTYLLKMYRPIHLFALGLFSMFIEFIGVPGNWNSGAEDFLTGCPDAGRDTMVCGFTYELQGSEVGGSWRLICFESAGLVLFGNQQRDTTMVKVQRCGEYTFEYNVPGGLCAGRDTVVIAFEDPSSAFFEHDLIVLLSLDAPCHGGPGEVVCDNTVEIGGMDPPELNWNICATVECASTILTTNPGNIVDGCHVDTMACDTSFLSDSGLACETVIDPDADDFLGVILGLLAIDANCPLPFQCFPPPRECLDTIYDTLQLFIPILDGGVWHFIDDMNMLVPLSDTTFITIEGVDYAVLIEPAPDYYGPAQITVTLWQIESGSVWIQPNVPVDLSLQWVQNYRYDTLTIIDTNLILVDSCFIPCGGITRIPATISIPEPPPFPCGPVNISFGVSSSDEYYIFELNCFSPDAFLEVCPGQNEVFTFPGVFDYTCINAAGCPYQSTVEIIENFAIPEIKNITTQCDPDNENYSVTFSVVGGFGQVQVIGFGTYNYDEDITIAGIPSCDEITLEVEDIFSGCRAIESTSHCCCTNEQMETEALVCANETYDFFGQTLDTTGTYYHTLTTIGGCDSTITLDLTVLPLQERLIVANICAGDGYDFYGELLDTSGFYQKEISNPDCDSMISLQLNVASPQFLVVDTAICEGLSYPFAGNEISTAGIYFDTLISIDGCDSIIELALAVITLDFEISSFPDCGNSGEGEIHISNLDGGIAPYQYSIDGTFFQDTAHFSELAAGNYTVIISDVLGCVVQQEIEIIEFPSLQIETELELTLCNHAPLTVDLGSAALSAQAIDIVWNDGDTGLIRILTSPGVYTAQITSPCESLQARVTISNILDGLEDKIYVPNVFSPNGDGLNDEFKVITETSLQSFELHLYDRWGDELRIFQSTEETWDGSFRGEIMNPGVYVWWLKAEGVGCSGNSEEILRKGDVTLIK